MPIVKKQSPKGNVTKKSKSVIDRINSIGTDEEFLKILLYGASGTGKTSFWSTMPGPILALITSGGNKTGELRSINTPENRKKIKQVTIQDSSEIIEVIDYVKSSGAFKTVVSDHVSGLQDLILKEILGIDEIPAQKGWGLASQQQYGQCTQQCKEYLRALLNLDANIVIIGQERTFNGKDDGMTSDIIQPTVGVAVAPSLAGWINPACDFVLQTFKRPRMVTTSSKIAGKDVEITKRGKGVDYCIRCEPHDVFMTKFRMPRGRKLPPVIVDPSYDKLIKIIQGE